MIFAREKKPITISESYQSQSRSHTRRMDVSLFVAKEFMGPSDRGQELSGVPISNVVPVVFFRPRLWTEGKWVCGGFLLNPRPSPLGAQSSTACDKSISYPPPCVARIPAPF